MPVIHLLLIFNHFEDTKTFSVKQNDENPILALESALGRKRRHRSAGNLINLFIVVEHKEQFTAINM
jgi:hypothetical protein